MAKEKNIPKELFDEIIAEYKAETSMKNICKKFGMRFGKIKKILNDAGVERRINKKEKVINESIFEAVKKARESGVSAVEIQEELKISHGTYNNILRALGLQRKQIKERIFSDRVLIEEIISYYQNSHTIPDVVKKYNMPIGMVYELFNKHNVKIKKGIKKEKQKQYDIQEIIKAYESGMKWHEMAEKFDMSISWLQAIFKKHGIVKKRKRKQKNVIQRLETEKNQIIAMYESGVSVRRLAQNYGTSDITVKKLLQKYGVVTRNIAEAKLILSKQEQEERVNNIAEAYKNGMAIEKIKQTYHTNPRTIYKIVDEKGIPRRKKVKKRINKA